MNVRVFGISLDAVEDQAFFYLEKELNFSLLSDPDGSAAKKYGVLPEGGRFASRVTFVLDEEGVLRARDDSVNVDTHGNDVVELVRKLRG